MNKTEIFNKLDQIITNSSSKYYHYPVAALLECDDGSVYSGVNIETSSPQAGVCAERCALFSAIANGYKKDNFKRIYILNKTNDIITPCFICRQALLDYCNQDLEIISFNILGDSETYILKDLTPSSFGEENLR